MDTIIVINIIVNLVLGVILILESIQYAKVVKAVERINELEEAFNSAVIELSTIVNNNADTLKAQVDAIAEHQVNISTLETLVNLHTEMLKLYSISDKIENSKRI